MGFCPAPTDSTPTSQSFESDSLVVLFANQHTNPATIFAGALSLSLGSLYQNSTGFNTPFTSTNLQRTRLFRWLGWEPCWRVRSVSSGSSGTESDWDCDLVFHLPGRQQLGFADWHRRRSDRQQPVHRRDHLLERFPQYPDRRRNTGESLLRRLRQRLYREDRTYCVRSDCCHSYSHGDGNCYGDCDDHHDRHRRLPP